MDGPIVPKEFSLAIKQIQLGKSPGPDGFSIAYYKTFSELLVQTFLRAFNLLSSTIPPPNNLLEAHISVVPKPGKDPLLASNYRPISLLNVNIKIFAKILANCLLPIITNLIAKDQVGFIPGREAGDNTLKAINIHHWLSSSRQKVFFSPLTLKRR